MSLLYTEQNIQDWRVALFESSRPYILISNVLSDAEVSALQHRWRYMSTEGFALFVSNVELNVHSPNYCNGLENVFQGFYMLPWNTPADHFTHELCLEIHRLRNRLEGNPAFSSLFPFQDRFLQYRVLRSLNGSSHVPTHADFTADPPPKALSTHVSDPSRIQATLLLSEHGRDYTGTGFCFPEQPPEHGHPCVGAKAGDLLLWRYTEKHAVQSVHSTPEQLGFLRIIFPVVDR